MKTFRTSAPVLWIGWAVLGLPALAEGPESPDLTDRDRLVLVAAVADVLDPKTPEYQSYVENHDRPREVVVLAKTRKWDDVFTIKWAVDDPDLVRRVPVAVRKAWTEANSGRPVAVNGLRKKDARVVEADLDAALDGYVGDERAIQFHKRYPNAWGWLAATRPGYSRDGRTALVVFDTGPAGHGAYWVSVLAWSGERWNVVWRRLHSFE